MSISFSNEAYAKRTFRSPTVKRAATIGATSVFCSVACSVVQFFAISACVAATPDAKDVVKDSKEAVHETNIKEVGKEVTPQTPTIAKSHEAALKELSQKDTATWAKARIVVKASPEVVWRTVHEERQHDPDIAYTKVLEQGEHEYKLEQEFKFIPILGTSVCVTQHKEVPFERIDYTLLKSDHFKAMEGSWTFVPADNGRSTILQLSSHLDLGLPVPRMFMNAVSTKKLEKRLAHIKELAENVKPVAVVHGERVTH